MHIPKSPLEVIILFVITVIVVLFTSLAVINIFNCVGIIASLIWIALITTIIWSESKSAGGLRKFLTNCLGKLFGRNFVEATLLDTSTKEIRFGFELLGQRFIQQSIAVDKIESIYWSTGQATDMAGHDMNDWHVGLWFNHGDPAKSEKRQKWRKPDQEIYIVGPSRRKKTTEKFGLAFVDFVRASGAQLVQGEKGNYFERFKSASK